MSSNVQLARLVCDGHIGALLVEAFGGTKSETSDFCFGYVFDSGFSAPSIEAIRKTVGEHFKSLGHYDFNEEEAPVGCFKARIGHKLTDGRRESLSLCVTRGRLPETEKRTVFLVTCAVS